MNTLDYLDLDTIAKQLDCNKARLLKAIKAGELQAMTGIARGYRVKPEWLEAWLNSHTVNTPKQSEEEHAHHG